MPSVISSIFIMGTLLLAVFPCQSQIKVSGDNMSKLDSGQNQKAIPHVQNTSTQQYDAFSKWLHWIMAVIIIYATIASVLLIVRWGWSFFVRHQSYQTQFQTLRKAWPNLHMALSI
nr:hypothetical protein [Vibrio campbellii]